MVYIHQLLAQKGGHVYSVTPDTTIRTAIEKMAEHDIGVLVILEGEKIKGIFSERDFTRAQAANPALDLNTPVCELMTEEVFYLGPDASIDNCMAMMTEQRIRHLPIVDDNKIIGLISIGDVVKELVAERDSTIRGLENYILGTDYNQ